MGGPGHFFVMGYGKSGTTWVQRLLDAHPQIVCKSEGQLLTSLAPALEGVVKQHNRLQDHVLSAVLENSVDDAFPTFDRDDLIAILRGAVNRLLDKLPRTPDTRWLGEKTPQNVRVLVLLRELFPNARLINVVRDGRDAIVSAWFHYLRVRPEQLEALCGNAFDRFVKLEGAAWSQDLEMAERAVEEHGLRLTHIRFEDLVADPAREVAALLRFLDLEPDAATIQRSVEKTAFARWANGREPGEEDPRSFFRKGVVGDWKNHFSDRTAREFVACHGDALARHGYR